MEYLYLLCLLISLGMVLWLKLFDVRNSTNQFICLLTMTVSNMGFYSVSIANSLGEAIAAQKIAYVGGIFLPAFYLFLILEICHIDIKKPLEVFVLIVQVVIYAFVCTIGKNGLFYKSFELNNINGVVVMNKEYGPLHALYPITMCFYLSFSIAVAIYSLAKKKSINRRGIIAMVVFAVIAAGVYVFERALKLENEYVPLAYIILMVGTMIPIYDSNIYTVYENEDIIKKQLDRVGFITFDRKIRYKGCDSFMERVFPELVNYAWDERIENCSKELSNLVKQISKIEEAYKTSPKKNVAVPIETFSLEDRYYTGSVTLVTNVYGGLKGYTIELNDETEHFKALELQERYSEELTKEVNRKTKRIRSIQQKTILGMARMVESRDLSTGGHIKRTSDVVRIFSKKLSKSNLGLSSEFLALVIRSAPMHDIGKIGVDDEILRKNGRFDKEDYRKMKMHAEIGYRMVGEILSDVEEPDFVKVAKNVAHYHHEKVDGTGYPLGLKGNQIPIEARIMALADVFDALVSKRCYKEAFSYDDAFDIIVKDSGTHFDSRLAEIFLTCREELEEYYDKNRE